MPSVKYYQNTAPFWDWVKSMEDQHNGTATRGNESSDNENEHQQPNPWTDGWAGFLFGPFPHRPRHHHGPPPHARGHHPHHHHGGPPKPPTDGESDPEAGPSNEHGPPEGNNNEAHQHPGRGRHGHRGFGGRGGPGMRHHHHHHHEGPPKPPADGESDPEAGPSNERGPFESNENEEHQRPGRGRHGRGPGGRGCPGMRGGGRGGFGGRGRGYHFHPYAQMGGPFGAFAQMFQDSLFGEEHNNKDNTEDYKPEADVFDTPEAFVVHVSLPGAKKEDVGVNWDAEKSELSIAGVTYRPGDEEFLKTLAMDERKVGPFERKVRLGSRANPAQIDVDGITARLEDGVLTVEVPKLDGDFVEVKKVDIE